MGAGFRSRFREACLSEASADTRDGLPRYSSEESLCIAAGNDISQKYSCGPFVISISAREWSNREKEIYEGSVHDSKRTVGICGGPMRISP